MLIALDENRNRVVASKANKTKHYFCQGCNEEVILKQGQIRRPHFSHSRESDCDFTTNKTEWHYEWQECFGLENAEKVFNIGSYKHIADIQIGDTIIEFQHSKISPREVYDRWWFYSWWNFKMVWIFDIQNDYEEGLINRYDTNRKNRTNYLFKWDKPKNEIIEALSQESRVFLQVKPNWLIEITWYPNDPDYGISMRRFSGNVFTKNEAIRKIMKNINTQYNPQLQKEAEFHAQQRQEMKELGLI